MRKGLGYAVLIGVLAAALPAMAQIPSGDNWHGSGTVGLDLSRMTQTSILPGSPLTPTENYDTAGGDLRLNLNGYIANPLFLPFYVMFNGEHASNSVGPTGYHDTMLGGTFTTTFLPAKPYPLRFFYSKTNFGATGDSFDQTNTSSTLGLEWSLHEPKVPALHAGFTRYGNEVYLPTSLFDTTYHQNHLYFNANDTWKRWVWSAGYDHYNSNSTLPGGFNTSNVSNRFEENLQIVAGQLNRPFWGKKALFHADNRTQWLNQSYPGLGASSTSESNTSTSLHIQHTQKLSSSYFYTFTRVTSPIGLTPIQSPGVVILIPPTFYSHYAGGRVNYQATKHIGVFEELRYQHVTPEGDSVEYRESLGESLSGVNVRATWKKIDLTGQYVGHLQLMGTNYGNHTHTFSNEAHGRAAWGDPSAFRLTFFGDYNKFNLVDQINGFTENHRIGAEVQTMWPKGFRWRFTAGRSYVEMLNISGNVEQYGNDLGAQFDQKHFSLGYTHMLTAGAGALFPEPLGPRTMITLPLPIHELVATPLLNRTTRLDAANLVLRLNRNLDLRGELRQERDYLATSDFSFRLLQIRLRYRVGKFTFEGSYGHFINDTISNSLLSGLHTDLYRLRVARDFRLF